MPQMTHFEKLLFCSGGNLQNNGWLQHSIICPIIHQSCMWSWHILIDESNQLVKGCDTIRLSLKDITNNLHQNFLV